MRKPIQMKPTYRALVSGKRKATAAVSSTLVAMNTMLPRTLRSRKNHTARSSTAHHRTTIIPFSPSMMRRTKVLVFQK
jgi:hypothetical protein